MPICRGRYKFLNGSLEAALESLEGADAAMDARFGLKLLETVRMSHSTWCTAK